MVLWPWVGGAVETPGQTTVELGIDGLSPAVRLGSGGSANVFAARRLATGEPVAVKLLRASADSEDERKRFHREQETLDRLSAREGIVPILDSGMTDRDEPYFLMPIMEGSLQDRIDQDGPLDWETASQLMVQVAETVDFAHQNHVLHRDLKPGNILLDKGGVSRVADFGIAKLLDASTSKSSKSLGTPSFMPPERFRGEDATEVSDVYGLGATLAALVGGAAPFITGHNDTDAAVMMRVLNDAPPDLSAHSIPGELADLIEESMAKDPNSRPASAANFAMRLRQALTRSGAELHDGPVTVAIPHRVIDIPEPVLDPGGRLNVLTTSRGRQFALIAGTLLLVGLVGAFFIGRDGTTPTTLVAGAVQEGSENEPGNSAEDGATTPATDPQSDSATESLKTEAAESQRDTSPGAHGGTDRVGNTLSSTATSTTTRAPTTTTTERPTTTTAVATTAAPTTRAPTTTQAPAAPVACFTTSVQTVEEDRAVNLSDCSTGATSLVWDLGDGSIVETKGDGSGFSHWWNSPGTYQIRVTATGPGGTHTAQRAITVTSAAEAPRACISMGLSVLLVGEPGTFSSCSSNATTHSWDFGDGATATGESVSHSWASVGTYTVRLTASGPGGSQSISETVTIAEDGGCLVCDGEIIVELG